jgi:uncharacterized protein (DUF924 family)
MNYQYIIDFWFKEIDQSLWYKKNSDFDIQIQKNFFDIHAQIVRGETSHWRQTPLGSLAEIIVLDQFSRNMFRDTPKAFAYDPLALALAQFSLEKNYQQGLSLTQKSFLYMPFMHSESLLIHEKAIELFSEPGLENNLKYERLHYDIIASFGRYPHRNKILARESSTKELEFLEKPNSSF